MNTEFRLLLVEDHKMNQLVARKTLKRKYPKPIEVCYEIIHHPLSSMGKWCHLRQGAKYVVWLQPPQTSVLLSLLGPFDLERDTVVCQTLGVTPFVWMVWYP